MKRKSANSGRTFTRFRTVEEVGKMCAERGWKLETRFYKKGSDHVSFRWKVGRVSGLCVVSTVNGRFFGEFGNRGTFSSDSVRHEDRKWFQTLLEIVYE